MLLVVVMMQLQAAGMVPYGAVPPCKYAEIPASNLWLYPRDRLRQPPSHWANVNVVQNFKIHSAEV